jgi:phosphoglycolate phosphatase
MPKPSFRSVTLDLDGTLLDTIPDLAAAANGMMRDLGRPEYPQAVLATFVGRGIDALVERCLPDVSGAPLTAAKQLFRQHYARENGLRARPFPGVIEGLDSLHAAGLPLAVITNKAAAFTAPLLVTTGLAPYFLFVLSGDSLSEKKPHPLPLLEACRRFGVAPGENLHIGDSGHDAAAARAAGCPVWLVPYGYNAGGSLQQAVQDGACDAIVTSLDEAARMLLGIPNPAVFAVPPAPTF